tara:strand:- start:318 stop:578 length:261 start_codon:yes stop_codon:yes gene_type:complete
MKPQTRYKRGKAARRTVLGTAHIELKINLGLHTRIYFDCQDNSQDPVLAAIDDPVRKSSLIAMRNGDHYNLDIHLLGDYETVFLNV